MKELPRGFSLDRDVRGPMYFLALHDLEPHVDVSLERLDRALRNFSTDVVLRSGRSEALAVYPSVVCRELQRGHGA